MSKWKSFLDAKGWGDEDAASQLEISRPYASKIRRGVQKPGGSVIARIETLTDGQVTSRDFYSSEDSA